MALVLVAWADFRFATPWLLALAPLAIVAAWLLARRKRRADARLSLPRAGQAIRLATSPWVRLERFIPWVRAATLLLLLLALARPQAGARIENVSTLGVDIVVALDTSGSMRAEDFQPNRLEAARETVERFVRGRQGDRIGLVAFSAVASTRCPLTQDHEMLLQFLEQVDFVPPDLDGTAIGLGLSTAVNRLRESNAKSKIVALLTDGRNNTGIIGPRAAAEAARALGVKVYTIGVGTNEEVPIPAMTQFGRRTFLQRIELDEELLKEIAEVTDGRYFHVADHEALRRVFDTIDQLEKTRIESRIRMVYSELFPFILLPALGLLLAERLLIGTRLRRLP